MTLTHTQKRLAYKVLVRLTECWQTAADVAKARPGMSEQEAKIGLAALPFTKCESRKLVQTRFDSENTSYRILQGRA